MLKSCTVIKIDFLWLGFSLGGNPLQIKQMSVNDGFPVG
jgi:hypothetical protein